MWLSRIAMSDSHFGGRGAKWRDGEWVHKRVMALFGPLPGGARVRADAGILFRVDPTTGFVLIQSQVDPLPQPALQSRPLDGLLDCVADGSVVAVRAKLNAVKTVNRTVEGRVVKRREAVVDGLEEWAVARIPGLAGVELACVEQTVERRGSVPLNVVTFDAVGRVVDAAALRSAVRDGVGRGRAYGCGLVTLNVLGH